jgi:L-alanine-DL-glutamate epimerase-like enolase superfamily enzyme
MKTTTIKDVRTYLVGGKGTGGDYHDKEAGHWITDTIIANPMSTYPKYKDSRTTWGIGVLGSVAIEIETSDGTVGVSTGFGGPAVCFMIEQHFKRFLVGESPHSINKFWDQMFRASLFYGRKGIAIHAISIVDLALWDLLGRLRQEPVWAMIGGKVRDEITFYCTGPRPDLAKALGFIGGKVPLPYGPADGDEGIRKNVAFLAGHREKIGPDFPLMVDCYMALTVPYAVKLLEATKHLNIGWWEEVLQPDDDDGFRILKQAHPREKLTTGEHEYTRYGFRKLIHDRCLDIIQPDVMSVGGLTEMLRISAMAAAYDVTIVPHASGPYSFHFVATQPHAPFSEYISTSADGSGVHPLFGTLFTRERMPENGRLTLDDAPGFGLELNPAATRKRWVAD